MFSGYDNKFHNTDMLDFLCLFVVVLLFHSTMLVLEQLSFAGHQVVIVVFVVCQFVSSPLSVEQFAVGYPLLRLAPDFLQLQDLEMYWYHLMK